MTYPGPLLADLYELTMAAVYFDSGVTGQGTFSLFARRDSRRGYFVSAGTEKALDYLERFHFQEADIAYLRRLELFSDDFLNHLATLRFTGDVWAMAEGTPFFGDEPILEVTAPIIQAQLIETYLINTVGVASMIATKASRCVHAAQGRSLIDFSLRRTQGVDAGLAAARSAYLAGFDATSNVLAGQKEAIPVAGTMAHSFVLAFEDEIEAFRAYARRFPNQTVLLIDTYDTIQGARHAVRVAKEMAARGDQLKGVRLDSGDMVELSRQVRRLFDDEGLIDVKIFASGGFDEYGISEALAQQAPIDAFGVGTKVGVSADSPFMDMVYKLTQLNKRPVRKLSESKVTLAGAKQIHRRSSSKTGQYAEDIISLRDEPIKDAQPLLEPVMQGGCRLEPAPFLSQTREAFCKRFSALPTAFKALDSPAMFPVHVSDGLKELQLQIQ